MLRGGTDESGDVMAEFAWDPERLPDLSGRAYLVTGATAGLGFFACEQLADAGAHVIMTGRNPNRLVAAREAVTRTVPDADIETLLLDTSNPGSVRAAAATVRVRKSLHGVLLNAGIVHPPRQREMTRDGHELVFATNALGHYVLGGELLTTLAAGRGRLVWLGSMATSLSPYETDDPELRENYTPWRAYAQSKIATTALGLEADRRLRSAGVRVRSVIVHPGYSTSGRTRRVRGVNEPSRTTRIADALQSPITQSKERGAWSLVRGLVDPEIQGGDVIGPRFTLRGQPRHTKAARVTRDRATATRLWDYCESATGVRWPLERAARKKRR